MTRQMSICVGRYSFIQQKNKKTRKKVRKLKLYICKIFVHTALAWFALGQKLIRDAIGAVGRLDTPNATEYKKGYSFIQHKNKKGK